MALTINNEMNFISYIIIATQAVFTVIAICAIWKYIKEYINSENRFQKKLFYSGLLFFILAVTTILFLLTDLLINEYEQPLAAIILALYGMQMFFLDLAIFMRVYILFNASPIKSFQISKCSIGTYLILFTFQIFMIIIVPVLFILNQIKLVFLVVIALIFISAMLNGSLATLFIYKLVKIQKLKHNVGDRNENEDFLNYVTKNAILTTTSCIATLFTIISFFMVSKIDAESRLYIDISILCLSFDCYTNFACVALTFRYFSRYYKIFCGCMDKSCHSTCGKLTLPPEKQMASDNRCGKKQTDLTTRNKNKVVEVSVMTKSEATVTNTECNSNKIVIPTTKIKNAKESPQSPLMMDDTLANMYKLPVQKILS